MPPRCLPRRGYIVNLGVPGTHLESLDLAARSPGISHGTGPSEAAATRLTERHVHTAFDSLYQQPKVSC